MTPEFLVVVINGPKGSGKTTIANRLAMISHPFLLVGSKHVIVWNEKMIAPVVDIVKHLSGLDDYTYEVEKDRRILYCGHSWKHTPREIVIDVDKALRKIFGVDYLAHVLIRDINMSKSRGSYFLHDNPIQVFIVDAGVNEEVETLKMEYGKRLKVIHLHRTGCEFNDGRVYLAQCDGQIINDGTIEAAVRDVVHSIRYWIEELKHDRVAERTTSGVSEKSP